MPNQGAGGTPNPWVPWLARLTMATAALPVVAGPNGLLMPSLVPGHYDHQRLLVVASLVTLALLPLLSRSMRSVNGTFWTGLPVWARAAIGLFFALGLVSAARSPSPMPAFLEWGTLTLAVGAVVAVAGARWQSAKEGDAWFLALTLGGVALYTGKFLAMYLPTVRVPEVTIFWGSPFFHFANVRFLNQFQSWSLPLVAAATLLAGQWSRTLRALLALLGGFWWALLFATGGRGALIAALLSTLFVVLFFRGKALQWLGTTLLLVGLGGALYFLLFYLPGGTPGFERAIDKSGSADSQRLILWSAALKAGLAHPFLGVGPMQLALDPEIATHPHNALLQLFAEWGLPATLAGVVLVLGGVLSWAHQWSGTEWHVPTQLPAWEGALPPALTAALFAGLGHGMVSGTMVMPMSQIMAVLVVGWLLGVHFARRKASPQPEVPRRRDAHGAFLAAFGLLGITALVPGFSFSLTGLPEAHETYSKQEMRFHPRFWLQGDLCRPPWPSPVSKENCAAPQQEGTLR
ncbi:O-antigen ligase family protein [Thiohalorhabdus sp. Cl-TMA]|uniref:O-antigen ligase family protein n=1 Tax=Thiohalorhabdus methylotrophus TaxID=3242694 RepID=A0ABV4TS27_9GAMM